jgi:hypothetical protein
VEAPPVADFQSSAMHLPQELAHPSADPSPDKMFVIPTEDGGQAVICEPARVAVSGTRRRALRDLSSAEKSSRRLIKNCILFGLFAALLIAVLWWLLNSDPLL